MQYFFASDVNESELDLLLNAGWRKFGYYFFRPACENCRACIPIRVCTDTFKLSKSQRRLARKNSDIHVDFTEKWDVDDRVYRIYEDHSAFRFGRKSQYSDFIESFGVQSCPSLLSKYYYSDQLFAVGFLDRSTHGLSSVYFVYHRDFINRSPGKFSILQEINYTRHIGLQYYYLGYLVEGNNHMAYKGCFFPHERMDWSTGEWIIRDE